ncbi:hypothetical protein ACK8QL_04370 [Vibrio cholerae]|uniref:hypothetical protein n=1 Tax=Vibrio cholerae TaxID=666 RepID=UPI0039756166
MEKQPTKKQLDDFESVIAELKSSGTYSGCIEYGPSNEWLGMVYKLNPKYDTPELQNHFAICVFNGEERV